jgi:sortase A
MSWGWLVALIVLVVGVGGLALTYVISNAVATTSYTERVQAGDQVATITIAAIGLDEPVPVLPGTSLETLRHGVGWYETTAGPGAVGNFTVTGHRLGWGEPFARLGELKLGDQISVQVGLQTYTYQVVSEPTRVKYDDASVLAQVPGAIGQAPTHSLITLVTAADLLWSPARVVVVGELVA